MNPRNRQRKANRNDAYRLLGTILQSEELQTLFFLKDDDIKLLKLVWEDGLTYKEIALLEGVTPVTIGHRYDKIFDKLMGRMSTFATISKAFNAFVEINPEILQKILDKVTEIADKPIGILGTNPTPVIVSPTTAPYDPFSTGMPVITYQGSTGMSTSDFMSETELPNTSDQPF